MKKIGERKPAFSLAEALITLLIVCLITLASVPVLTKKKRNLNLAGHGVWMCTRNAVGEYVYYSKEADNGDPENPETWTKTGKQSCEFQPSSQLRNFSVIVVGGGGGGGNGVTDYEVKATTNGDAREISFKPSDSAFYDVLVIGGGGGGGNSQNTTSSMGGGAGSGGMFQGYIPLFSDVNYKMIAGGGGNSGGAEYHGGSSDSNGHGWGNAGSTSYFQSTNANSARTTNIVVSAGSGGEGVGCSKWSCGGGSGVGSGGNVTGKAYVSSYAFGDAPARKSEIITSAGKSGSSGAHYYSKGKSFAWGGQSNYKNPIGQVLTYGNGGYGGGERVYFNTAGSETSGTNSFSGGRGVNGFVMVSQNVRKFGRGGTAAQPVQQFVPSINGKLAVTISEAAEPGKSGGPTTAKFVGSKIDNGKVITGYGAAGGISTKDITVAEKGEDSKWVNAGGGIPAEACQPKRWIPGGSEAQTIKVLTCKKVGCTLASTMTEAMFIQVANKNGTTVDGVVTPKWPAPVEAGKTPNDYDLNGSGSKPRPPAFDAYLLSGSLTTYIKDVVKLYDYIVKEYGLFSESKIKKDYMITVNSDDSSKSEFSGYENSADIYNNYACYSDFNIKYQKTCMMDEYKNKTVEASTEGYWANASCGYDGGNGLHIGAGGGGGSASETSGISSKGGKGGYGGVIVEW